MISEGHPPRATVDVDALVRLLGDVPTEREPTIVRRRSRDFFWYSPILADALKHVAADIIVRPRDEADVIRTASACAKLRIPLTVRAGGTGNYGQAMPLAGGVLLEMTELTGVVWQKPGSVRVRAGTNILALDQETRPNGYELRMHPSTKRTATIGGFVAGGSGGVGSVAYGGLREPGNILAARVVTVEEEPRILELRQDAAQKVNRAYGTTGIITELEMPTAPAWAWIDVIVAFDSFAEAFAAGRDIAHADGVVKKLVTPIAWPIPGHFVSLKDACPEGKAILICMIAEPFMESFEAILGGRGTLTYRAPSREEPGETPLYEYAWNHTTLQWLKTDRSITYLQLLYPHDRLEESVRQMAALFEGEVLPHLEFIRFGGRVTCSALPVVRYTSPERLFEIIRLHEEHGVMVANPHVFGLEGGSRHKRAEADQLGFKAQVDPMGLLNPGKMESFVPVR
ncbi:FAD-binding oxidoreductase [Phreatobacter cathodiphilus]|uniref:FAD-linked oxidase n=1 Tax=Phreatobacter cathodiphilus TaxID=1868589 RepID=A0A2S0N9E3_9HYPH|nr:FAD-binding oxidoreductase [Phreatobacter cathodiphilus]AVO44765.1 FAD-linked oxidase [Phreatobacter cathodiphilus]